MAVGESSGYVNEVRVLGRVSAGARERTLPSGDTLVSLRVVVPRPASAHSGRTRRSGRDSVDTSARGSSQRGRASRVSVDTFECVAWGKRARMTFLSLGPDEHVVVEGSLRRRFWRSGGGVASMVEIDVSRVRRVTPRRRSGESAGRTTRGSTAPGSTARAGPAHGRSAPSGQ